MNQQLSETINAINAGRMPGIVTDHRQEQRLREQLAAYFLTAPKAADPDADPQLREALRALSVLEIDGVLQASGIMRPLRYGDVTGLLTAGMSAASDMLRGRDITLVAQNAPESVYTSAETRVLLLTLGRMIRQVADANPAGFVIGSILLQERSLSVAVSGAQTLNGAAIGRYTLDRTMALMKETARLHKGSAALSGGTLAFSMRRELSGAIGLFNTPTAHSLRQDPLAPLSIGFYGC